MIRPMPLSQASAETLLDEINELFAIMLRIGRRVENPDEPMTATQRLALIEVAYVGPLRLTALAARMDTTAATVSRAIDALQAYGLVVRRADPADGRAVLLSATAKGKRWTQDRRSLVLSVLEQLEEGSADVETLAAELGRLSTALRHATGHNEVARGAMLAP
jgi:DNA-binding MarR family transcriptional regulator